MAVAVPKHRSGSQAAPSPSRTAPPEPKKRPRDRPKAGGQARSTATPTAPSKAKPKRPRKVRLDDPPAKAGGKRASSARAAATKTAPARRKVAPKRRPASVIPIAAGHAGRAAVAVTQLPESGLIHRLTRGRAWIGVLGVLLVGIVALNVVTLSFAASSGKVDAKNTLLGKENSMLQGLVAKKYGQAPLRHAASGLGLKMAPDVVPQLVEAKGSDVSEAAARLAAAAPAATTGEGEGEAGAEGSEGTATGESTSGEAVAGGATGEESASGESSGEEAEGSSAESEFTPEELAIYEQEYAELLASEGVTETPAE
jgi:hypothetical protein